MFKLEFGPKAFIVVSDPVVARHLLKVCLAASSVCCLHTHPANFQHLSHSLQVGADTTARLGSYPGVHCRLNVVPQRSARCSLLPRANNAPFM